MGIAERRAEEDNLAEWRVMLSMISETDESPPISNKGGIGTRMNLSPVN
jgi:hypothetical protein